MKNAAKLLILFNPSAGSGKALARRNALEGALLSNDVPFEMIVTESEGHLRALARNGAASGRTLVGAGGDSTFHIMVNEIMAARRSTPLGIIGTGSSNDIALEFGLETLDKAALALKSGRIRKVDLGVIKVDKKEPVYFLGQANIGLGAAVNRYVADLAAKRSPWAKFQTGAGVRGILNAYRTGKIPVALGLRSPEHAADGSYVLALFSNIRYWSTGKIMCPGARPDDGLLDACLFKACSFRRLARLNALAKRGRHGTCPEVDMLRSASFEVTSNEPFLVQTDGEVLGGQARPLFFNKIGFSVIPGALKLIC